jgi:hypothetical protein
LARNLGRTTVTLTLLLPNRSVPGRAEKLDHFDRLALA